MAYSLIVNVDRNLADPIWQTSPPPGGYPVNENLVTTNPVASLGIFDADTQSPWGDAECFLYDVGTDAQYFRVETVGNTGCLVYMTISPADLQDDTATVCIFLIRTGFQRRAFNHFPNKPRFFLCVWSTSVLKTLLEKKKLLVPSNFSFSHTVFYPFEELSAIFIEFEIVIWEVFQFERA